MIPRASNANVERRMQRIRREKTQRADDVWDDVMEGARSQAGLIGALRKMPGRAATQRQN